MKHTPPPLYLYTYKSHPPSWSDLSLCVFIFLATHLQALHFCVRTSSCPPGYYTIPYPVLYHVIIVPFKISLVSRNAVHFPHSVV